MKSAKLEIVIHCGKDLKNVKHFSSMNPVATVWVAGDGNVSGKETPVAENGDCDPKWECSMHFDITSIDSNYILIFKLEHRGSWTERLIGEVQVPFADLIKAGDARAWCRAAYPVTIPNGMTQGEIIVSRKFSEEVVTESTRPASDPTRASSRREKPRRTLRRQNLGEGNMSATRVHQGAGNYGMGAGTAQGNGMFAGIAQGIAEGILDNVATAATTALFKALLGDDDEDKDEYVDEDEDDAEDEDKAEDEDEDQYDEDECEDEDEDDY